jgi:glycosyltransferase involved in cell wall biosynthesis
LSGWGSVILSTFNQPRPLALALRGYGRQTHSDFEVIVADDGSGPETAHVVQRAREQGLNVRHAWQDDRGFRKTEALNRAIGVARGAYLIFSDGDCIPRDDFVATHARLAEPDRFLSGGYLKLPESVTRAVDERAIDAEDVFDAVWLRSRGYRPGRRALRLTRNASLGRLLDAVTPTPATWNGHSASTWKEHLLRINGFDLDMGWGGLDRAAGERLENAGIRGKQVRHRAVCVHLYHGRPYKDPVVMRANREIRDRIRRDRETRAPNGLAETQAIEADVRIDPEVTR